MSENEVSENSDDTGKMFTAQPVNIDRVTIWMQMHHESFGNQPTSINLTSQELLGTQHEPFTRRIQVSEERVPLSLFGSWIPDEEVGYVVLENLEGKNLQRHPSEEEKKDIAKKTVVVFDHPSSMGWRVAPGLFFVGYPRRFSDVRICTLYSTARCRLVIFPK